jgi:hypothetical protein
MKNLLIAVAVALPLTFAASPSHAGNSHKSDCARAKKKGKACKIEFKGDDIGGKRRSGDGDRISTRAPTQFGSLIKLRYHFHDMVIKAADNI